MQSPASNPPAQAPQPGAQRLPSGSSQAQPIVSAVIVTYCSADEVPACVHSLRSQGLPLEIFLVDNASPDNTPSLLSQLSTAHPNIAVILNQRNVGLAAANNQVIGRLAGEYLLVLNPDTRLAPDALARMVNFLNSNPDFGIVGPLNLYQDGVPHRSFHAGWGIAHLVAWRLIPYRVTRTLYDRLSRYHPREVRFVSGAALLIRSALFEAIGGYDPGFFLSVEDACDLCIRARQAGSRVQFLPEAQVVHYGGRSGEHAPYIVILKGYLGTMRFFAKHHGAVAAHAARLILLTAAASRWSIAALFSPWSPHLRTIAKHYGELVSVLAGSGPAELAQASGIPPQRKHSGPTEGQ